MMAGMQDAQIRAAVLIEGSVTAGPFQGAFEGRVAVYPAARFAGMACNPAIVWAVARAHDGCHWSIRKLASSLG
jgi:hypothetical protein